MLKIERIGHDYMYDLEHLAREYLPGIKAERAEASEDACGDRLVSELTLENGQYKSRAAFTYGGETFVGEAVYPMETREEWKPRTQKTVVKLAAFRAIGQAVKTPMPWGTLIGIRPAKLTREWLESGMTEEEVLKVLKEDCAVSSARAKLALDVAKAEQGIIGTVRPGHVSLYLHIPFCPTRCLYCSFVSQPLSKSGRFLPDYLKAMETEIRLTGEKLREAGLKVDAIYIGGGTPTALTAEQLEGLLSQLGKILHTHNISEFTVEAGRPDTITKEKLQVLKANGVTRLSVNPQTMQAETLQKIGRQHTPDEVKKAFSLAREVGFSNINMDLIAGLIDETPEMFFDTLKKVRELDPENITIHTLCLKRAARLNQEQEDYALAEEAKNTVEMLDKGGKYLLGEEYYPYYMYRQKNTLGNLENVGYAKPGYASYYNVIMMEDCQTVIGIGAGSTSKIVLPDSMRMERFVQYKNPEEYIRHFDAQMAKKEIWWQQLLTGQEREGHDS